MAENRRIAAGRRDAGPYKSAVFPAKLSVGTVNAKKRTNVLVEWTVLLFFVHFVCGFAAWMFLLTTFFVSEE